MPIYKDNAQNRKLKRVGMGYGTECSPCKVKKKEEPKKPKKKPKEKKSKIFTPAEMKGFEELDKIFKLNGELLGKIEDAPEGNEPNPFVKKFINELKNEYDGTQKWKSSYKRLYNKLIKIYNLKMAGRNSSGLWLY